MTSRLLISAGVFAVLCTLGQVFYYRHLGAVRIGVYPGLQDQAISKLGALFELIEQQKEIQSAILVDNERFQRETIEPLARVTEHPGAPSFLRILVKTMEVQNALIQGEGQRNVEDMALLVAANKALVNGWRYEQLDPVLLSLEKHLEESAGTTKIFDDQQKDIDNLLEMLRTTGMREELITDLRARCYLQRSRAASVVSGLTDVIQPAAKTLRGLVDDMVSSFPRTLF